jgi:hypothetical protein
MHPESTEPECIVSQELKDFEAGQLHVARCRAPSEALGCVSVEDRRQEYANLFE